jgi:hypothetical protein
LDSSLTELEIWLLSPYNQDTPLNCLFLSLSETPLKTWLPLVWISIINSLKLLMPLNKHLFNSNNNNNNNLLKRSKLKRKNLNKKNLKKILIWETYLVEEKKIYCFIFFYYFFVLKKKNQLLSENLIN